MAEPAMPPAETVDDVPLACAVPAEWLERQFPPTISSSVWAPALNTRHSVRLNLPGYGTITTMEPGLLLVRHGQSTWNAIHRWAGQADPPLSEEGRRQAHQLGRRLRLFPFEVVVSSDLGRAAETATVVADELGIESPTTDARLRERHCIWSGLTSEEIEELHPGQLEAWRSGELHDLAGESEPWEEFRQRIETALDEACPPFCFRARRRTRRRVPGH